MSSSQMEGGKASGRAAKGSIWLLASVLAVIAFQSWTLRTSLERWPVPSAAEQDYYNLLSRGFASGQLSLAVEPHPDLARLENPYDPRLRPGIPILHDVCYFKGRYYLYWGPAPVVVLFLPFRLVTGTDLPSAYANLFFTVTGFLAVAWVFNRLRRDYFPEVGNGVVACCLLALGLGAMTLSVIRRPSFWELPIAAGYAFGMLGLAFLYAGWHSENRVRYWAAASAALGLAIASRPTYAFGIAPLMLATMLFQARREAGSRGMGGVAGRHRVAPFLSLVLPCGLLFAGLLYYNYARFENPLEFGIKYQLSASYEFQATHFSAGFIPYNFFLYYLAPAQWGRYFPFVQLIDTSGKQPAGYYGMEYTYGILANLPLVWFGLALPLFSAGRSPAARALLTPFIVALVLFFVGIAGLLLCFCTAAQRYMVDFAPALVLLGGTGALSAIRWLTLRSSGVGLARGAVILGAIATATFGVLTSFQLHGMLKFHAPAVYARLGSILNRPAALWERIAGGESGPLELELKFPSDKIGKFEPLLSTGWEFFSDQIAVYYTAANTIQLLHAHVGKSARLSEAIPVDFAKSHTLSVEMGSLYPPREHPVFAPLNPVEQDGRLRYLKIVLDGRPIFQEAHDFYDSSPGALQLGGTNTLDEYGTRFSGVILRRTRHVPAIFKTLDGGHGVLHLSLRMPETFEARAEPLVAAGEPGRADVLAIKYESAHSVRFLFDHWGVGLWSSPEIALKDQAIHELTIDLPSWYREGEAALQDQRSTRLRVSLDGQRLWECDVPTYAVRRESVTVGLNPVGSSICQERFSGLLLRGEWIEPTSRAQP